MDRPIQVGDLVVILRGCCDDSQVGHIKTVEGIRHYGRLHCSACGLEISHPFATWLNGRHMWGRPLSWLKRIDPLSELDDVKREEEITV